MENFEMDGADNVDDEWVRLLGGAAAPAAARPAPCRAAAAEPPEEWLLEDEDLDGETAAMASEGSTSVLFAAIRSRLAGDGKAAQYQEFLAAASKEPIDSEGALAALSGYSDLASEFRRAFGLAPDAGWAEQEVAAEEAAAAATDEKEEPPPEFEEEEEEGGGEPLEERWAAPAPAEPRAPRGGPPPIVGGVTRGAGIRIKQPGAPELPVSRAEVPMSRSERFKHRLRVKMETAGDDAEVAAAAAPARPAKRARTAALPPVGQLQESLAADGEDEVSAATFLASVKARLLEWGKVEQYHEFVLALAGTVDARAAVRILRGHDDLLRVFQRKFAPRANLMAIKAELDEEPSEGPRPPSRPPPGRMVKEELGGGAGAGPRPPSHPPGALAAKREMVKAEVKREYLTPRPPASNPHAPRGPVTIGDDSDGEEEPEIREASLASAVRKGSAECIAQLARTLFRQEREQNGAARVRMALVHYATRVAACPRFPRELHILRGAPGTGKTEYAMGQLAEYLDVDKEEEEAARLTHVCAADDFFGRYVGAELLYKYEGFRLESACGKNETRVMLAMEAGIHPLFVDCANLKLWEMRSYVFLAERLGYVVKVVEPWQISHKWDDVHFLASAQDTAERRHLGKVVQKGTLAAQLQAFEALPEGQDPLQAIRRAARPAAAQRLLEAVPVPPKASPAAGGAAAAGGVIPGWRPGPNIKGSQAPPAGMMRRVPPRVVAPRPPSTARLPPPPGLWSV